MIERKCRNCKYVDVFLHEEPCASCRKYYITNDKRPEFVLDPVRYFKGEMRRLADKYNLAVRFPEDRRAEFALQHAEFYASINTEWTESRLEAEIKSIEEQIKKRLSEKKDVKEKEMIEKRCLNCEYCEELLRNEPCFSCCNDYINNDARSGFKLDPIRYFKRVMEKLVKEFGVDVEFDTHYIGDYTYMFATFSHNGSKCKYRIEIHNKISESKLMDLIEVARRNIPTIKNPEPVVKVEIKANNTFGIKQAMHEASFGQVTYADNRSIPKIKDVKFNGPATIVFWEDGTKTVVKCQNGDTFDPEKGLAMAIAKKALGNEDGYYSENIGKWVEKFQKEQVKNYFAELDEFGKRFARDFYNKLKLRGVDD